MTKDQEKRLNMYHSVIALFNSDESWKNYAPVQELLEQFTTLVNSINDVAMQQHQNKTKGYTLQKSEARKQLQQYAYDMVLKLKAFANHNKNLVLKDAVNYSISAFDSSSEIALVNSCQSILDNAVLYKDEAADYSVNDQAVNNLRDAIESFKLFSVEKDTIGDKRTLATANLKNLFKDSTTLIESLDLMVEGLIADKNFVGAYFQARKVPVQKSASPGVIEDKLALE